MAGKSSPILELAPAVVKRDHVEQQQQQQQQQAVFTFSGGCLPIDTASLLYQSRARVALRAPNSKIARCASTQSQRDLVVSYARKPATAMGSDTTSPSSSPTEVVIDVDVMTLHRLLMPPSFETNGGGAPAEGVMSSNDTAAAADGHAFGMALLEANWEAIVAALFPLTIGGKGPIAAAASEAGIKAQEEDKGSEGNGEGKGASSPEPPVSTATGSFAIPFSRPLPLSFASVGGWKALRYDSHVTDRFSYSYAAWLRFFGWRLHDEASGEVDRHSSWRARYAAMDIGRLEREAAAAAVTAAKAKEGGEGRLWQNEAGESVALTPTASPAATARYHYLTITVVLQCLLELKLFPLAARLLLFLLEEFAAGRLRWLLEAREGWLACDFSHASSSCMDGEVKGEPRCTFCGQSASTQTAAERTAQRRSVCAYLAAVCLLRDESPLRTAVDAGGRRYRKRAVADPTNDGGAGSEADCSDDGSGDSDDVSGEDTTTGDAPLPDVKPLLCSANASVESSSDASVPLSLFDDLWYPMVQHFNYAEGNCYDGNGDLRRLAKARAALDASDSE